LLPTNLLISKLSRQLVAENGVKTNQEHLGSGAAFFEGHLTPFVTKKETLRD